MKINTLPNPRILDYESKKGLSDAAENEGKNSVKAVLFALAAGVLFATANAMLSVMSSKHGSRAICVFWIGGLLSFVLFHVINGRYKFEKDATLDIYFKKNEVIADTDESRAENVPLVPKRRLDCVKICFVIFRAAISLSS